MTTFEYAQRYLAGNISIIPIALNGEKRPAGRALPGYSWNEFKERLATPEECERWWGGSQPLGLAAVGGEVSAGLELIDFDIESTVIFPSWRGMVDSEYPDLLDKCCIVQTPRLPPGFHVWLRCVDAPVPGSEKLANLSAEEATLENALAEEEGRSSHTCLIETKGEGGYGLVPGCPPECHPNNACYTNIGGQPLWDLPPITAEEREFLITCARSFNREQPAQEAAPKSAPGNDLRPGDDFEKNGWDWAQILEPHGWILAYGSSGSERRWRRPSKEKGWSATTGKCKGQDGADLLHVFSSSADPFALNKSYGKFRAFALLNCDGDWSRAAKDLANLGFGGKSKPKVRGAQTKEKKDEKTEGEPVAYRASIVKTRKVTWLWPNRIPEGKLATFAGIMGIGKTFLLCDVAARVSAGHPWPDYPDKKTEPADVLFISGEDEPDDTLVPRLIECKADLERVWFLSLDKLMNYTLENLETLDAAAALAPRLRLVVIDPPSCYLGDVDDHKNAELRRLLTPLKHWATAHMCSVVFNTHLNKAVGMKEAQFRVIGSVAWMAAVRAGHLIAKDPDDRTTRIFAPMKITNGKEPPSLTYTIDDLGDDRGVLRWTGVVDTTADEAVNNRKSKPRGVIASEWLIEQFREKLEWRSDDLFRAAKEAGVSRDAVFEAKKTLELPKAKKIVGEGGEACWYWWVPTDWVHLRPPVDANPDEGEIPE